MFECKENNCDYNNDNNNNAFNTFLRIFFRPKEVKFSRGVLFPKKGCIYDYVYTRRTYGAWRTWGNLVNPTFIDEQTEVKSKQQSKISPRKVVFFIALGKFLKLVWLI